MAQQRIRVLNIVTGLHEDVEASLNVDGNRVALVLFDSEVIGTHTVEYKYECFPLVARLDPNDPFWRIRRTSTWIITATGKVDIQEIYFPFGNTGYAFAPSERATYGYQPTPDFN